MTNKRFPPGGERQPVFRFLQDNGYTMSKWSDKHWSRSDGVELHLYGTGSMAKIYRGDQLLVDDNLADAVTKAN